MKLHVTHDENGNIIAIAIQAPDTDGDLRILAEAEQIVSEVEVEDDPADLADEEKALKRLAEIAEGFRVEVSPKGRKLVSRRR